MNKGEISFVQGALGKKILKFVFPLIIAYLIQQAYNSADLIIVGHYMGTKASSAIGASSMVITLAIGLFGGLSMGVGMLYARAYGANDSKRKKDIYRHTNILCIVMGLGITALGYIFAPNILILMQTPGDIFELATTYLRIYLISLTFMAIFNMFSGMSRASGNSKIPMIYQGISGGLNVVLDLVLINIMDNGIQAVAWATVISQGLSAFLIMMYMRKNIKMESLKAKLSADNDSESVVKNEEHYTASAVNTKNENDDAIDKMSKKEDVISKKSILSAIFILGLPVSVQTMVVTISNMFVQANINALGVDSISAFTAYFKIELFMYYPILSIGQAVMYAMSQNIGAGKYERLDLIMKTCIKTGLMIVVPIEIAILVFGGFLFGIFNPDSDVISLGLNIIYTTVPFYWLYVILECMSNGIRAMGRSTMATVVSIFSFVVMRIGLLVFLSIIGMQTIVNVASIYPITWGIAAALYTVVWCTCKKVYKRKVGVKII